MSTSFRPRVVEAIKKICDDLGVAKLFKTTPNKRYNPPACRRVLWILFFVVVLSVLSAFLSRLSPWRGFLPRLTWTPALLPPSTPSSSSFRLYLSLRCGGLNSAHASLHTAWFILVLHILLSFRWLFPFFWLRLPSVCSVASYIQYFNHWHNLSKYCLFQRLFQFAFSKTLVDTCFGLNLNRGLNKTNVLRPNPLLHKELFYTKTVLSTNTMLYTKTMLLLGLCKGCLQLTGEFFPWWPAEHAEGS